MPEPKAVYKDGTPVPSGYCIMPDHYETTVVLKLRSLTPIGPNILKDTIQARYEVTGLEITESTVVVRNSK